MSQPWAFNRHLWKCTHLRRKTLQCHPESVGGCRRARWDRRAGGRIHAPRGTTTRGTPSCLYLGTRSKSGDIGGIMRYSGCIDAGTPPLPCQVGFVRNNHTLYLPILPSLPPFAFHADFIYPQMHELRSSTLLYPPRPPRAPCTTCDPAKHPPPCRPHDRRRRLALTVSTSTPHSAAPVPKSPSAPPIESSA